MGHSIDYLKVEECKLFLTQTLLILQSVECIFAMPFIIAVRYQIYNKNKGLLLHILVKPLVTLAVSQEFCKLFDLKGRHLMQFCSKILQYNIIHFFFFGIMSKYTLFSAPKQNGPKFKKPNPNYFRRRALGRRRVLVSLQRSSGCR